MASREREEWALELARELNCEIAWDSDKNIWNTCKKAWRLHDPNYQYHLVIQDDAILSKDFIEHAIDFIVTHPNEAYQFYWGNDYEPTTPEKGYEERDMAWGVAICLKTELIDEMIRFGNVYQAWQDDVKIKHFLKSKGIKTLFPIPCLVNHRKLSENQTLTPCVDSEKYSKHFKA